MYSKLTFDEILKRMLARVASKYDKREGSVIWDALAPASVEFMNFYVILQAVIMEMFADTATRNFLIKHCADRGITPKKATQAVVLGKFTPETVEIEIGKRFSHEDFNYYVNEKVSDGLYELTCETYGSEPNGVTGRLIPIDYVANLETAEIIGISIHGEDDEDTESLRARYFDSLHAESFGGNEKDYIDKITSMDDVGGVKVYSGSEWNGGGTVKCVIQNSNYEVPSLSVVEDVQKALDPDGVTLDMHDDLDFGKHVGEGKGLAPIGHFVTVVGVNQTPVNITTNLTYAYGYSWDRVKDNVVNAVKEYFNNLNKNWSNTDAIRVRIAQLESRFLSVEGVVDVQDTTLNGGFDNITLDKDSIVTRGTINGYSGS